MCSWCLEEKPMNELSLYALFLDHLSHSIGLYMLYGSVCLSHFIGLYMLYGSVILFGKESAEKTG